MKDMQKPFLFFVMLVIVSFLFLPRAHGLTDNCRRAVTFYNQASEANDPGEKERLLNQALSFGCSDRKILAKVHNNLADSLERQGRLEEAEAGYYRAIEADPFLATPYLSLGDIYAKLNMRRKADRFYEKGFLLKNYRSPKDIIHSLSPKRTLRAVPSQTLYFGFDRADLNNEAQRQLKALTDALNSDELLHYRFSLEGHTCSMGTSEYNQSLSERRAGAVMQWLTSHGIPQDRLMAQGFGEERPIADNSSEEGRRHNRRVEMRTVGVVMPGIQRGSRGRAHNRALDLLKKGEYLLAKERYQEALGKFLKALDLFKQENDTDGIDAAHTYLSLTYRYLGDGEKAEACAIEIRGAQTR